MSQQSSTASNTPSEPLLCEMGCGFFGNPATGNCCSKCWRESQKKKENAGGVLSSSSSSNGPTKTEATPMEVDTPVAPAPQPSHADVVAAPVTVEPTPAAGEKEEKVTVVKKKKKKTSYKSMMAGITKRTKDEKDIEKEKESLRKVTGGGVFAKIDKI